MYRIRKFAQLFLSIMIVLSLSLTSLKSASAQAGDGVRRRVNTQTGRISFIGPENGRVLSASKALGALTHPQNPALALAKRFGPEFGLKNPERDLTEIKTKHTDEGRVIVRYQQNYEGVPVMGGELMVNTNDNGDLYSISGEVSSDLSLPASQQPKIDAAQARDTVLQAVAKWYQKSPKDFIASEPELWIFDESLLRSSNRPAELVWRMEVTSVDNALPVRELVLVNAERGNISLHFNQVDTAWEGNNSLIAISASSLVSPVCSTENGTSSESRLLRPYIRYNCGLTGHGVGVGDFNNDGKNDVALSVRTGVGHQRELLIFLQNNNGTLSQPVSYAAGSGSDYLAVGDLNNDGWDDVVTLEPNDVTISVYLQIANGGLANRITYSTNTFADAIAVGDINNDGLDDVVTSHYSTIGIFRQKPDGTLNTITTYSASSSEKNDIAIGDVNNDGLNDIVNMKGAGTTETLLIYIQNNNHTLNPYYSIYNCSLYCGGRGVDIGDVTGDGRSDVVMSFGENSNSAKVAVFRQGGNGSLQSEILYPSYDIPRPVEIADMNSDNSLDVVTLHNGALNAGVYLQQNGGTLSTETLYPIPYSSSYPQDLSIGDINSDGLPDILIADELGLVVLYRRPVPSSGGYRVTYTANQGTNLPGQLLCDETALLCTNGADPHADAAHKYAGGTYDLYKNVHHRNSIDNNGMTIISSVHYDNGFTNAFWDGTQMVFGDGYGFPLADDVVAHELTHGVTEHESDLFYYYQPGAINESFSDLWGEYYDQTNGLGDDSAGVKWLHGEDVSGQGASRSMSDPTVFGDPDKMSSPNYYEGQGDNGGVHYNSGINNKAVFLMVDGGTFNGKTVSALGWTKTAAIYYEVQTNLLISGSDYSDLYYALQQACSNLIGQKGITNADCVEVKGAIDAVEMNSQPAPDFNSDAPLCDGGITPTYTFTDDLEAGTSNWTFTNGAYPRWQYDSPYGQYAQSGSHFLYADDYPDLITDASARLASFIVPPNAYMRFAHAYDFET